MQTFHKLAGPLLSQALEELKAQTQTEASPLDALVEKQISVTFDAVNDLLKTLDTSAEKTEELGVSPVEALWVFQALTSALVGFYALELAKTIPAPSAVRRTEALFRTIQHRHLFEKLGEGLKPMEKHGVLTLLEICKLHEEMILRQVE